MSLKDPVKRREYSRKNMAKWRAANPEKVEAAKPAAAVRTAEWLKNAENRERNRLSMQRIRAEHKAADPIGFNKRENERNKLLRAKVKAKIVEAYGGKCSCEGCPVTEPEFLTVHHTKGDGAAHRATLFPRGASGGYRFYLWLQRNGFPKDGFALHCYNCNCSKGFHGYCPHERLAQGDNIQPLDIDETEVQSILPSS